ncbi:MAG: hypothetical protein KY395_03960 [Actinobacteria bacterium]|nr:hypothetical protein [Actinomycetota bacterium]
MATQWEYTTSWASGGRTAIDHVLAQLDREGWEAIGITSHTAARVLVALKRKSG